MDLTCDTKETIPDSMNYKVQRPLRLLDPEVMF
jgi:hypothetical protein